MVPVPILNAPLEVLFKSPVVFTFIVAPSIVSVPEPVKLDAPPILAATLGSVTNATLMYDLIAVSVGGFRVDVSTDVGTNWTNGSNVTTSSASLNFEKKILDLNSYIGQTNMKLRFYCTSSFGTVMCNSYALLDNVIILNAKVFTSSTTWTVPSNVCTVTAECWGCGGAGGRAKSKNSTYKNAGGGGSGGAYALGAVSVTPNASVTITVGASVNSTTTTDTKADGNPSWFQSISDVYAPRPPLPPRAGLCPSV